MDKIKLIICDDQQIVREGLQTILKTAPNMDILGLAEDGRDAIQKIAKLKPGILVVFGRSVKKTLVLYILLRHNQVTNILISYQNTN
ncbi:MAG: hypothetical protein HN855_00200 [Anaerolineae bacterium]|nr:hypothetical protein [Anaerolineae bacterium]MBT7323561.1 hypothetical protein [Anaerolineae bacterium]